ncbi:MAG: hypothetical protein ACLR8R_10030 [Oscillospiraceae bacterium]
MTTCHLPVGSCGCRAHRLRREAQRHQEHHCPPGDPGLPRIKIGTGAPGEGGDMIDWVIGVPSQAERKVLVESFAPGHRRGGMYH